MTQHNHAVYVPGCYRCDLSRDEGGDDLAVQVIDPTQGDPYRGLCHGCGEPLDNGARHGYGCAL